MMNPPIIFENDGKGERGYDIYSRLLKDRIVFLGTPINDAVANNIVAQFLYLNSTKGEDEASSDISFYINSPGGSVTAGMAIRDIMNHIDCDVKTVCIGQAASMGALLLSSGTPGKRFALENARVMIHQPLISGGLGGQASDIEIEAEELLKLKSLLTQILADNSGKSYDEVLADCDRNKYLSSSSALEYGLIDGIYKNGELSLSTNTKKTRRKK